MSITESERLFHKDNSQWIFNGDARDMYELPDGCAQMVCTSPPYWGLRKYEGEQELIWGDSHCEHQWGEPIIRRDRGKAINSEFVGQPRELIGTTTPQGNFCSLCGAWKGQLGLEPEPDCGRPYLKLKDNLTDKQREYVMSELKRFGLI